MESSNTRGGEHEGPIPNVERLCPECGAPMVESDRLVEDGAVFIWYECSREDRTAQWLSKKILRMRSV